MQTTFEDSGFPNPPKWLVETIRENESKIYFKVKEQMELVAITSPCPDCSSFSLEINDVKNEIYKCYYCNKTFKEDTI